MTETDLASVPQSYLCRVEMNVIKQECSMRTEIAAVGDPMWVLSGSPQPGLGVWEVLPMKGYLSVF